MQSTTLFLTTAISTNHLAAQSQVKLQLDSVNDGATLIFKITMDPIDRKWWGGFLTFDFEDTDLFWSRQIIIKEQSD